MSTALAKIDPEIMEQVVVHGDLSRLTPPQRLTYYAARCEAAGLDPRARPFQYLQLQGKLVLYADKGCADQLIASRSLTIQIMDRRCAGGLYEVQVRVTRQDGTHVDDLGVVPIEGLKGEAASNAVMKALTKAKRRAVLSACGLGMTDDSEVDSIQGARRVTVEEAEAPALPPVPALPPPPATPIAEVLKQIKEAPHAPALDEIRESLNKGPKRSKAEAAQIRDALKARAQELAAAEGAKIWSQQIAEAQDSPTLDQIRGDLVSSNLTEDQKRALMGEIAHRRADLGKVGLGNYDG